MMPSSQLKTFTLAALAASLLSTTTVNAQSNSNKNTLPEIGTAAFSSLSLEKERQLGDVMIRQLRASQPVIHDPVLTEYINDLGNRLVKNANDVNYSFNFFLINNKEINAFAFFGGHVGVHTGLIGLADNESELASVLAHEISHVTQRHLARRLEAQQRSQPLTLAAMMSGILLSLVNPSVGFAAITTSMAAQQQQGINFTRGNEKEADRVGIDLLVNSGFDPNGAPNFFTKMADKYRYSTKPPAMLLTHPLPDSRISDARLRAQNIGANPVAPSLAFELAKARINTRYKTDNQQLVEHYQHQIQQKSYAYLAAAEYGLALAYFEQKAYAQALNILEKLLTDDPKNLFFVDVLTDAYIQTNQHNKAIDLLSELNLFMPNNQVVTLNYANALQEAKKYQAAEVLLQDFILLHPDNFVAHDLLTTVYEKQNKQALKHVSKAEVFAMLGGYERAVDELQTAYNYADDRQLLQKRIKAKILQYQQQQEKLKQL